MTAIEIKLSNKEQGIIAALAKQAGVSVRDYIVQRAMATPPSFNKLVRPTSKKGKPSVLDILFESRGN